VWPDGSRHDDPPLLERVGRELRSFVIHDDPFEKLVEWKDEGPLNDEDESPNQRKSCTIGLDLGQAQDPTAAVVVEKAGDLYTAKYIVRYPLGTSYPAIVKDIDALRKHPDLQGSGDPVKYAAGYSGPGLDPILIVDRTGVGRAVADMIREVIPWHLTEFVTLTTGKSETRTDRNDWNVGKINVIAAAQAVLASDRLIIPPSLPHAELLKKELRDYHVKITDAAHETFAARQGSHDDILIGLALALWWPEFQAQYYHGGGAY